MEPGKKWNHLKVDLSSTTRLVNGSTKEGVILTKSLVSSTIADKTFLVTQPLRPILK